MLGSCTFPREIPPFSLATIVAALLLYSLRDGITASHIIPFSLTGSYELMLGVTDSVGLVLTGSGRD